MSGATALHRQVADLALRLDAATQSCNWDALRSADRELAAVLPALKTASATWGRADLAGLARLRRSQREARRRCDDEAARVEALLNGIRDHKDGWMAYAMAEPVDGRTA